MRALLTGASSFTGYWFARKLRKAGFTVVAPLRGRLSDYSDIRNKRAKQLFEVADVVEKSPFGSAPFLEIIETHDFDVLCHHAARVEDYRSLNFDITTALADNTHNLPAVLERMQRRGLKSVVITGSVFEDNEGAGSEPMRAFSPYGLSKTLTAAVFRYWCAYYRVPMGKFVIPNPFGPFEEPRFCSYLIKTWRAGMIAEVRTPNYLRDNIHVDLLALAYVRFVTEMITNGISQSFGPMGYAETQGAFAERYAREMRGRLGLDCPLKLLEQVDYSEPLARINTHPIDTDALGWSEGPAWDRAAEFYRS